MEPVRRPRALTRQGPTRRPPAHPGRLPGERGPHVTAGLPRALTRKSRALTRQGPEGPGAAESLPPRALTRQTRSTSGRRPALTPLPRSPTAPPPGNGASEASPVRRPGGLPGKSGHGLAPSSGVPSDGQQGRSPCCGRTGGNLPRAARSAKDGVWVWSRHVAWCFTSARAKGEASAHKKAGGAQGQADPSRRKGRGAQGIGGRAGARPAARITPTTRRPLAAVLAKARWTGQRHHPARGEAPLVAHHRPSIVKPPRSPLRTVDSACTAGCAHGRAFSLSERPGPWSLGRAESPSVRVPADTPHRFIYPPTLRWAAPRLPALPRRVSSRMAVRWLGTDTNLRARAPPAYPARRRPRSEAAQVLRPRALTRQAPCHKERKANQSERREWVSYFLSFFFCSSPTPFQLPPPRTRDRADRMMGESCVSTNLADAGLRSVARNNKATRLLTRPGQTAKSSAKDSSLRIVKLQSASWTPRASAGRPLPAC